MWTKTSICWKRREKVTILFLSTLENLKIFTCLSKQVHWQVYVLMLNKISYRTILIFIFSNSFWYRIWFYKLWVFVLHQISPGFRQMDVYNLIKLAKYFKGFLPHTLWEFELFSSTHSFRRLIYTDIESTESFLTRKMDLFSSNCTGFRVYFCIS